MHAHITVLEPNSCLVLYTVVAPNITAAPNSTTQFTGENMTFTCTATGIPLPTITWSSDDIDNIVAEYTRIDNSTIQSEITVTSLESDIENYACNAANEFGYSVKKIALSKSK